MSLWFAASAVSPSSAVSWSLTQREAAWLTTIVQLGFVAGTAMAALLNFADVIPRAGISRRRRSSGRRRMSGLVVSRRIRRGARAAFPHRVLSRRRVPTGDEDGVDLVPCATRPRHRNRRRRADDRKSDAISRACAAERGRRPLFSRRLDCARPRGDPDGDLVRRRPVPVSAAPILVGPGANGLRATRVATGNGWLPRPHVRALLVLDWIPVFHRGERRASGRWPRAIARSVVSLIAFWNDRDRRHRLRLGRTRRRSPRPRASRHARDGAERQLRAA